MNIFLNMNTYFLHFSGLQVKLFSWLSAPMKRELTEGTFFSLFIILIITIQQGLKLSCLPRAAT